MVCQKDLERVIVCNSVKREIKGIVDFLDPLQLLSLAKEMLSEANPRLIALKKAMEE